MPNTEADTLSPLNSPALNSQKAFRWDYAIKQHSLLQTCRADQEVALIAAFGIDMSRGHSLQRKKDLDTSLHQLDHATALASSTRVGVDPDATLDGFDGGLDDLR